METTILIKILIPYNSLVVSTFRWCRAGLTHFKKRSSASVRRKSMRTAAWKRADVTNVDKETAGILVGVLSYG